MYAGWKVVVGLFVVMALSSGLGFYNHAVLIQALAQTGNFSVTSASSAVSLFFIVSGLTGLVVAPLAWGLAELNAVSYTHLTLPTKRIV